MRFALAALLVVAVASTATATEYLWFEAVSGGTVAEQGPGMILEVAGDPGEVITIGAYMTDGGAALRGYSFELDAVGEEDLAGSALSPDASGLWTSSGGDAGTSPLVSSFALTAGTPPVLGDATTGAPMIMSFDITIGATFDGDAYIDGNFLANGAKGDGTIWGAYYAEAYVGATYLPAGQAYSGIGHYAGFDFGNVIHITPEPAALVLLGFGAVALLRRR